ncbi:MAG TPA: PorV/PorQ family protein [Bacteroidota bacterium]|nr:PorV/PorQ family protein [Bacteroidota bacterium]
MSSKKLLVLILALLVACASAPGQRQAGINGASFLKVGVGARSVGMGSAVTTLGEDVEQMFWNPAGIALKEEKMQASFSYANWLAGITHVVGSLSYNLDKIGTLGVGLITFGDANIPAMRDPYTDPSTAGTYSYMDMAAQVTFARNMTDRLALGITVKYINEKIDDRSASAVAVDVGSLYDIGMLGWKVGARLSNVGSDLTYYDYASPIPITFSMGTSIIPLKSDAQSIMVAADVVKQQDYLPYFNVGLEYGIENMIALRAGYKLNYSDTQDPGRTNRNPIQTSIEGWSLGAGLHTTWSDYSVAFDYSFTDMKILNDVHRFTLHFGWK